MKKILKKKKNTIVLYLWQIKHKRYCFVHHIAHHFISSREKDATLYIYIYIFIYIYIHCWLKLWNSSSIQIIMLTLKLG